MKVRPGRGGRLNYVAFGWESKHRKALVTPQVQVAMVFLNIVSEACTYSRNYEKSPFSTESADVWGVNRSESIYKHQRSA
jgi:hypothetical protein